MLVLNKVIFLSLVVSLTAGVYGKDEGSEITNIETNVIYSKPDEIAVLTQLKSTKSESNNTIYNYKCTVGTANYSDHLACTARDSISWDSPHNAELKLRCPKSGYGLPLSYVEIVYSVSSPSTSCVVNDGDVGMNYIGVTVQAWNTLQFIYTARFYNK